MGSAPGNKDICTGCGDHRQKKAIGLTAERPGRQGEGTGIQKRWMFLHLRHQKNDGAFHRNQKLSGTREKMMSPVWAKRSLRCRRAV